MRSLFILLFFVSGVSGLIYESVWTHYLKLFLGHAAYAQALVLAIFMGGMALGAFGAAHASRRWSNLLRAYALAEGLIGLAAFAFHFLFVGATDLAYTHLLPSAGSAATASFIKWSLGTLLILPQSILLGATFPLMSAGLIRRYPENGGGTVAILYFANSLGGALGVLISGFLTIKHFGLPGTLAIAGAINLILAAAVYVAAPAPEIKPRYMAPEESAPWAFGLLAVALLTGLSSFVYEIGWIRMLVLVLGASTHAFELMLAAFILGLALGGLWIKGRIDKFASPLRALALMQILMGLAALATLALYDSCFDFMQWLIKTLEKTDTGYLLFNLASHGVALAVMLPAAFFAGTTLPLITRCLMKGGCGEAGIGRVYGANTLGAILGVMLAVHIGLPALGVKSLIVAGAALDLLLGIVLLFAAKEKYWRIAGAVAASAGAILLARETAVFDVHKMASGVYRSGSILSKARSDILGYRDGKTASISLAGRAQGFISIRTNGKADASIDMGPNPEATWDEATMVTAGALPTLLHQNAKKAANIGFGSGLTSQTLLAPHLLEKVDTIEIEAAMVQLAQIYKPRNRLVYEDNRSEIVIDDAKTYFSTHNRRYDVIVAEPSNPWVSGVAGLFSVEFYRHIKRHLNESGILVQWMQMYEIDLHLVGSVLKAVGDAFGDYAVYAATQDDLLIVARKDGPVPPVDDSALILPSFAAELARIGIKSGQDVAYRKLGDKRSLDPLLRGFPLPANSDYFPVLDQNAAKARYLKRNARDLVFLTLEPLPLIEMLTWERPGWTTSAVAAAPFMDVSGKADTAQILRDAFRDSLPARVPSILQGQTKESTDRARRILNDCAAPPPDSDPLAPVLALAQAAIPHLRPGELRPLWERAAEWPCVLLLPEAKRPWLALFAAIGERDAKAMADQASALLPGESDMDRGRYLLNAALLGLVAAEDRAAARQLIVEHRMRLYGRELPPLALRLLAAHALAN